MKTLMKPLKRSFFLKETSSIAEKLLGCFLVRRIGQHALVGRIVETEAYLGLKDPSCHSFKARYTKRTQTFYLEGGWSYVYLTYGMHYCFNVITGQKSVPEAVLIRALEPIRGISKMQSLRGRENLKELCSGPGKLCQAFAITKQWNAKDLTQKAGFFIAKGPSLKNIETDARVGLPWHKDSAYWFLRFYAKDNPYVSIQKNQIKSL